MDTNDMIAAYERILGFTGAMLESARQADWDRLVAIERACRTEVEHLVALTDRAPPLPPTLQARKAQIIRGVLADDAEIRRLVEPGMARLDELIGNTRNQQRLLQLYGAPY